MIERRESALAGSGFGSAGLHFPLSREETMLLVRAALHEDGAAADVTTAAIVPAELRSRATLVARCPGVIAGVPLACEAFRQMDESVDIAVAADDGVHVDAATPVLTLHGSARGMLAAERVALNFVQRLSGVATLTARYVSAVQGTGARILDTRKTTPGWRVLEKYAVRCGGGLNHRAGLAAAVLIKDNHLAAVGGDVTMALHRAREHTPAGTVIEVECEQLAQVEAALAARADVIMLDNMGVVRMQRAVELIAGSAVVEASGGVNLSTVRAIAETGVDWISVGALTHSAHALDMGLDFGGE